MLELHSLLFNIPQTIRHPFNHSDRMQLDNPELSIQLLDKFLSLPDNSELKDRILNCLSTYNNTPPREIIIHQANLQKLVLSIEPFLQKLAAIDPVIIAKDPDVSKMSWMNLLCSGKLWPKMIWNTAFSGKKHDDSYWRRQDCLLAIFYEVYRTRNLYAHEIPVSNSTEIAEKFYLLVFFSSISSKPNMPVSG